MTLVPAFVRRSSLIGLWTSTQRTAGRPVVFLRWLRARDVIDDGYFATRPFTAPVAYLLVLGLYLGSGFGKATVAAVNYLRNGVANPQAFEVEDVFDSVGWIVMAVCVWVMFTRMLVSPDASRTRHRFHGRDAWLVVALDTLASFLSFTIVGLIAHLVGSGGVYPAVPDPSPEYLAGFFASLAAAGFKEEIFLLGLPVLLLRSARRGWSEIVVVLAILRLSFHIYYGVPAAGLVVWAVLAVFFFRYTQAVWPLVLSHSMLDLCQGAFRFGGDAGVLVWFAWVLSVLGLFIWLADRKTPVRAELGLEESPLTREHPPRKGGLWVSRPAGWWRVSRHREHVGRP